jgi:nucleoside-diphosphate-sugar epimerase
VRVVAVTGATGFIGSHVVRRLAARGDRVIAFGRRAAPEFADLSAVTYLRWTLPDALNGAPAVDAVVHCAGTVTDWGTESVFIGVNVEGTKRVLRTFAGVRRFVHLSTASVYDPRKPKRHVKEDAPYAEHYLNEYARSKMLAELAVHEASPDAVILRPHAVYGPGDDKLAPRLLEARWFGTQLALGDGRNRVSVTHVDNLVQAVECAIDGNASGTFNIADGVEPTVNDLLQRLLAAADLPARIAYVPAAIAWPLSTAFESIARVLGLTNSPRLTRYVVAQLTQEYTLDLSAAVGRLGYRPVRTYIEGIGEAFVADRVRHLANHQGSLGHQHASKSVSRSRRAT